LNNRPAGLICISAADFAYPHLADFCIIRITQGAWLGLSHT